VVYVEVCLVASVVGEAVDARYVVVAAVLGGVG